jgi:hypothetical protein
VKYYSFVVTLLLFIPYLFDLLEQGGSNINEILNDFLIQTINGFLLFKVYSLNQQSGQSSTINEEKSLTAAPKKSHLVQIFLNMFKEEEHHRTEL